MRAAYSRTFETPFNENLLLSSATGSGGLAQNIFGAKGSVSHRAGLTAISSTAACSRRSGIGWSFDADYFWKFTHNAYDFDVLFNTPITFPIAWHNSKLDGLTGRLSTINMHGFQAYTTFGHTPRPLFSAGSGRVDFPGNGERAGRVPHRSRPGLPADHQPPLSARKDGLWGTFIWRYDSGLVVTGVPDAGRGIDADRRAAGGHRPRVRRRGSDVPRSAANLRRRLVTSTLLTLPQTGAENNDHNPDRVKPRNLFDMAVGTDNLFHAEHYKMALRFTVTNLTNKVALYNFLSTFSGTHFVAPRTYQASIGYVF